MFSTFRVQGTIARQGLCSFFIDCTASGGTRVKTSLLEWKDTTLLNTLSMFLIPLSLLFCILLSFCIHPSHSRHARYPNCNSRWASGEGGKVWCEDPKKVPRKIPAKTVHGTDVRKSGGGLDGKTGAEEAKEDDKDAKTVRRF